MIYESPYCSTVALMSACAGLLNHNNLYTGHIPTR